VADGRRQDHHRPPAGPALGKRFVDSDHEIEARTGASIPWIFEIEGEASFRRREAEVIRELTAQRGLVLATGGGAVLDADSRALLAERGTVVYLRASVEQHPAAHRARQEPPAAADRRSAQEARRTDRPARAAVPRDRRPRHRYRPT
jgi:shikimate kinase/3-dehydroquinate synthase